MAVSMSDEQVVGSQAPPLGTRLGAGYLLQRFLGAGGMGAVYGAVAPDGRQVAVKVLLDSALRLEGGQYVERFKREANVTSTLDSVHIVPALDAGIDETLGLPYMVMPLMLGTDVQGQVDKHGPLHPAVAARVFRQACAALAAAHRCGVIHRDIKPANIFLDHEPDGRVTVRVLDFGIAKWQAHDTNLTRTGSRMGTPYYMSPEQCQSVKSANERSDVWSVGVSLYEALCGRVPFADVDTLGNLFVAIISRDAPPLQDRAPWIIPDLAAVVHGALIRDQQERCPGVEALAQALLPYAYGSDELRAHMLQPLTPDVLQYRAERRAPPSHWTEIPEPTSATVQKLQEAEPDPLVGLHLGNRYQLLRCLGRGGMGAVYEAEDVARTRFAVKVVEPDTAGASVDGRRRFVREARAVMSIDSPHVVRVFEADADSEQQLPYIVMELLVGTDLGALIDRIGAIHPRTVVRMFVQACRGLAAAHSGGFVHRDIKPANLFLHHLPNGELQVKVCDFGVVKRVLSDGEDNTVALTRTGGVVGSPMWMSPEQSKNARDLDLRTDVWSLGVSLFQALCGENPWKGRETVGELIVAICTEDLPHVQDRAPWLSPGLAEVVHRAMSRAADDRFSSMAELEQALLPFAEGTVSLRRDDLVPVSEQQRSRVAERSAPRAAMGLSTQGAVSMAHTVAEQPKRSPAGVLVGAVALALVAGGGIFLTLRNPQDAPAAPHSDSQPTTIVTATDTTTTPPRHRATVRVDPPQAEVTVNGEPQPLEGGALVLAGESGASFEVTLTDGDHRETHTVVITRDGKAMPAELAMARPVASTHQPSRPAGIIPPSKASPTGSTPIPPPVPPATTPPQGWREEWK